MRHNQAAFTVVELLVAVVISSILITITVATYSLFRRSMTMDQSRANLAQNARIAMDRMSREIRQTPDVVTVLPSSPSDTSVTQPGEIEFEDGHAGDLTYKRYYISGGTLKMDTKEYYFATDPTVRVTWSAVGSGGVTPVSHVISTQDIADSVASLAAYGDVEISLVLTTSDSFNQQYHLRSTILRRN